MTSIATDTLCVPLENATDASLVGGKAAALGAMLRARINVPNGFVLTVDALEAHLVANEIAAGADDIRETVRRRTIPDAVREQLRTSAAPLLAGGPVVVRSSAVGEDGETESFAGQHDSILDVRDPDAMERAVLTVWSSLWSDRALFYRKAKALAPGRMAVVVQRQVDARAAGVLFTTTTSGEMLVEYAPGLGDALVAGTIDPGRVAIDRKSGAGCVLQPHDGFALEAKHLLALRATGLALETELGGPQDVEWAIDGAGELYAVQSRPITAVVEMPAASSPRKRSIAWSNANVNENFPRPVSPFLYSIATAGYTHYFRNLAIAFGVSPRRVRAMEPAFQRIIGVHGARMYYNLTAIHSVLRLAPFGKALTASFDAFVGADGADVEAETVRPSRVGQIAEVGLIIAKAARLFLQIDARVARFERTVDAFAARTHPSMLQSMTLGQLREALAGFMEIRCHKWLDASLADAASMLCYGALERLLKRANVGSAVHTTLLKAIPDVVSGEPVLALWDLSRLVRANPALHRAIESGAPVNESVEFNTAFTRYLDDWGFRCSEELMLTSPSFQENPEPLLEMLRAYARLDGGSPRDALRAQAEERERETLRVVRDSTPAHAALRFLLPRTHAAIRYRERARLKQALLYSRCRRIALALGDELARRGTIVERDDVFFLTQPELDELASGGAMFPRAVRETVVVRKAEHARLSATTPPDSFTLAEGEYWVGHPEARSAERSASPDDGRLRGTSACGGKATGRATVLRDVTESARLARGDILVTKQTDPGWGPVFFLISGLVIERGGMLSHGAIIAREFGIPCVVGVKHAMERIPSGATITVDGNAGEVDVIG